MSTRLLSFRVLAFTLFGAISSLQSQTATIGGIHGFVKDTSGAVVGGARITVTDSKSEATRSTLSEANGEYTVKSLMSGDYTVKAEVPGFQVFERKKVYVSTDKFAELEIALAVSSTAGQVEVSAKLDAYDVVPARPTDSLFGIDKPIEEIPRSISVVESETLQRYNVHTVNDLVTVSPGSFTGSYFGVPGSLFIRGEAGDNFFRGFRRVENRGNYQTPVGATDHIEIVKGPPSPIYGGGKVGGFLNFIPKSARSSAAKWMEKPEGKVTLTYGSYDQKIASLEYGIPFHVLGKRAGMYTFFEAEDSRSFYDYISNRHKLGQIAFDVELSKKWRLEFGMQGYSSALPQNIGWNRVTQDLVDHQKYITGQPAVNLARNGYNLGPADIKPGQLLQFAFTNNFGPLFASADFAQQAQQFALDPKTMGVTTLTHNRIFGDTPDFADAITFTGYFDAIYDIRPGLTFKNQTFYDSLDHQKYSSYGFSADYTPYAFENKSSFNFDLHPSKWVSLATTAGFSYRYSGVTAGESRTLFQVIDRRDLSVGPLANDRFQGAFNSGGALGYNYFQKGNYGDAGLFFLTDATIANKLDILYGARYDRYTPDFTGRDNGEAMLHATSGDGAFTQNVSVSYKLPHHVEPYVTYATSTFLDLGQGGELDVYQVGNGSYLQKSNLYEAGVKANTFDKRLYGSFAFFRQRRSTYNNEAHAEDYFRTKGTEVEVRAAATQRLAFTGAFTWQKPEQLNVPFLLGIPGTLLGLTQQQSYGGRFIGLASIFNLKAPVRVAGQPPNVASVFGTYTAPKGYGFTVGTTFVSAVNTGYISTVRLPSYFDWRGSAFYNHKNYSVNLGVRNMFDQKYYTSQFLFWDVFIKPSELRTLSLTVSYRF